MFGDVSIYIGACNLTSQVKVRKDTESQSQKIKLQIKKFFVIKEKSCLNKQFFNLRQNILILQLLLNAEHS